LRDIADRKLGSIAPPSTYKGLESLMGRTVKTAAIEADWEDIVRIVATIKEGAVAPSAILRKLAAYKRQNRLDFALAELGRIERTLFTLDWLEQPDLRRACQAGLNKGEARHTLAAAIYTNRQGRFTDRSIENQEYRASGLNLLIAAIAYWGQDIERAQIYAKRLCAHLWVDSMRRRLQHSKGIHRTVVASPLVAEPAYRQRRDSVVRHLRKYCLGNTFQHEAVSIRDMAKDFG
jgi:hypothetical protein